jgi:hypothetical protein
MRVIHFVSIDDYPPLPDVRVCSTEEEYFEEIAAILKNDRVRSVTVYDVKEAVELSRHEMRESLKMAATIISPFSDEGAIIRKAMVDKALWAVRKLALQKLQALQPAVTRTFKVGDVVANLTHKTVGVVLDVFDRGDVRTDADGVVCVDELEAYNAFVHQGFGVAPSTGRLIKKKK